ncbi:E3 ubiquitin-protein ligase RNF123 isoform X2 [Bacillus rossius redtenbacheri]|uniref:E3 ubiquitin-protein ligase RNF123 isoform X2 n=1 Tax=Bacillus rossius redtenbacheri TaxID=93214 RepID=UPI002FDEA907
MEVDDILMHIFGSVPLKTDDQNFVNDTGHTSQCLERARQLVARAMQEHPLPESRDEADAREGRLGPSLVCFDTSSYVGLLVVGSDRLSINSQSNFSTIRANVCVYKGKWQYEVQLGSKGVMQLGWATSKCKFSQEIGVGDTVNSFAYDGSRLRKWNVATYKYGEPWLSGDIIGCLIDMDDGTIEFYRNGNSMGQAFSNIQVGPGRAYFPAVSLAYTENLVANFGSTPFRYPVPGYEPIQQTPHLEVARATQLCHWLSCLLDLCDQKFEVLGPEQQGEAAMSGEALLAMLALELVGPLAPLLGRPYVVEQCLVPLLERLSGPGGERPAAGRKFTSLLDFLWLFLEDFEMSAILESSIFCLVSNFRHVSFGLEYPTQKRSLLLVTFLLQHTATRRYLLEHILFDRIRFLHVKPLDDRSLQEVVKDPWWDTQGEDPNVEANKEAYLAACCKIKDAIATLEELQVELLITLLDNTDGTPTRPSSRIIFLSKFRAFLHENILSQIQLPIALCFFFRLLVTFRELWQREMLGQPVVIPARYFYDGSINYDGIDRLGGVVSHLNKTLREDLIRVLGADHRVISSLNQSSTDLRSSEFNPTAAFVTGPPAVRIESDGASSIMIPVLAHMHSPRQMIVEHLAQQRETVLPAKVTTSKTGNADPSASLLELLDGLILFYHTTAHKQVVKVSSLRDSMADYAGAVAGSKARLAACAADREVEAELRRAVQVLEGKLAEQARGMAWVRAAVYCPAKQEQLAWLLRVALASVRGASREGRLFSYVPEFYLEALVGLCAALRGYFHPTCPIEALQGYKEFLVDMAEFLCDHFADQRIIHANSKDTMIQALASFVCSQMTLDALEEVPQSSRINMVHALLRPYENRAWAQSNWVLLRMWQGCGFAFRFKRSPHLSRKLGPKILHPDSSLASRAWSPCPSQVFQGHIREVMLSNETLSTSFLNSLLNQLNWAFSEFIGMLQEIQNVSNRPERVFIESRQLRICATCFDLALSLLRVLEMVASVAGEIFKDPARPSSELLLSRLCQLLCQVLNRVSSQAGCFQHVVQLEIPDLETVDHFPILAAVVGVLLALLSEELQTFSEDKLGVPIVSKVLLSEPSFQMGSLSFLLGDLQKVSKDKKTRAFSFSNYCDDVTVEEVEDVRQMIAMLDTYSKRLSDECVVLEEDLCTICYAYPISTVFVPCNHRSCRTCITHYLMNSKCCFFCKAVIEQVISVDGSVLHDLRTSSDTTQTD